jgi:ribosomal protein S1
MQERQGEISQTQPAGEASPQSFGKLLDEFHAERPKRGALMQGYILKIEEDTIFIDIGAKRDALVPRNEVDKLDERFIAELEPGDEVPVYVLRTPIGDQRLLVSIQRGRELEDWDHARDCLEQGKAVELEVSGINKGGVTVHFERVQGFVPNSHIPGLRRGLSIDERQAIKEEKVGTRMLLKVIEVDQKRRRLILSGRAAEKERGKRRLRELQVGTTIEGKVVHIVDYGAFVDLGGVDGMIHISELDWHHVGHPSEVVEVGELVEVEILDIDIERARVSLSRKACLPDPWRKFETRCQVGDLVEGEIVNVVDFGAFVAVKGGIEGLIHTSELGVSGGSPQDLLESGESVVVKITQIDAENQRLALSLRNVTYSEELEFKRQAEEQVESEVA